MLGRRRRSPRPKSCIPGSGPKAAKTSRRSSSLSLSRVSSSWLRTKWAHWQASGSGGSARSASAIGAASPRAKARYIAWLTVNANSICSWSPRSPPK